MLRSIGLIFVALLVISPQRAWALANPASVFCAKSGGKSEIRKGPRGQYGVCRLPDGRVVDEWAYFRAMTRPLEPIPINWIAASFPASCLLDVTSRIQTAQV